MAIKSKRTKSGLGGHPSVPIKHSKPDNGFEFTPIVEQEEDYELDDNDISLKIRDSVQKALQDSAGNISGWLKAVGDENPARALALFKDFTEFVVPRLQRADGKLDGGSPVQVVFEGIDQFKEREAQESKKKLQEKEIEQQQAPKKAFTPVENGKFF